MDFKQNIPLKNYTTLGIGGPAELWVEPTTDEEVRAALRAARDNHWNVTVFGGGSNVLVADSGITGLVVHLKTSGIAFAVQDESSVAVTAAGGEHWDALVETVCQYEHTGLWGLENLSGIPGSVGAAPIQNINAYGSSVGDVISAVRAINIETLEERTFTAAECVFGYRDSFFKTLAGQRWLIVSVTFVVSRTPQIQTSYRSASQSMAQKLIDRGIKNPTPSDVRTVVLETRKNIGMLEGIFQSAGSFFKNSVVSTAAFATLKEVIERDFAKQNRALAPWYWPQPDGTVKISTAFLLECTPYNKTAFKDKTFRDTVGISPVHSLSIINKTGTARAADVCAFAEEIIASVYEHTGVMIEWEVKKIGF